jgi:hypothetical protein
LRISDTDCITDAEEEEEEEEEEKQKHQTLKAKEKEKEKQKEQEQEEHPAARGRILSHGGTPQTTPQTPSALDLIKSFNASVRRPDNLEKVRVCTRPLPERWCPGALFCFSALSPLPVRPAHVHRKIENGPCISRLHIAYALPLFHG